jgi:hypothetical protein
LPKSLHLRRLRGVGVRAGAYEVVVGEIDAKTTLSPVKQRREVERAEGKVVAEAHLIIRRRISNEHQ